MPTPQSGLISTLTSAAAKGLTPDQIADALKGQSDILYFDRMTYDQAEHLGNTTECALFEFRQGVWHLNELGWEFWGEGDELSYFNRTLWAYACVEMENYYDGLLPDRAPERPER